MFVAALLSLSVCADVTVHASFTATYAMTIVITHDDVIVAMVMTITE